MRATVTILPAADEHCVALAPCLRAADVEELKASSGRPALELLRRSLAASTHAVAAVEERGVVCMFGVGLSDMMSEVGSPWLLGSDLIGDHRREFARRSRAFLALMLENYGELRNAVDARHVEAIRWLRWLGFTIGEAEPTGRRGELFRPFHMRRGLTIQKSTVAEIEGAPNFRDLLAEYTAELAIDGLPEPAAKLEMYRQLERSGALHIFSATNEGRLVGLISVLAPVLPHYGVAVAVTEFFFVAKAHRNTLAGLRLLRTAEDTARELGSPGLLVSAPYGGKLFQVLPKAGYVETNRVFFKKVSDV